MSILEAQAGGVDDLGHQRQLFGGADGAADTAGIVGSGFFPGVDVFKSFGAVEFLIGVEDIDLETGTLKRFEVVDVDLGRCIENFTVKSGVIPPVGGNLGKCTHNKPPDFFGLFHFNFEDRPGFDLYGLSGTYFTPFYGKCQVTCCFFILISHRKSGNSKNCKKI